MNNILFVKIIHAKASLKEIVKCFAFTELLPFPKVAKEGPSFSVFEDEINVIIIFEKVVKLYDIAVIQSFLDLDLPKEVFQG